MFYGTEEIIRVCMFMHLVHGGLDSDYNLSGGKVTTIDILGFFWYRSRGWDSTTQEGWVVIGSFDNNG